MRVHLVHAHPVPRSFGASLFHTARAALVQAGHEVRAADLYADGFEPVLSAEERRAYHQPGHGEALRSYVETLAWAEAVILIYPTWWYGMPAMMKGYIDRVWMPDVAFSLPGPEGGAVRPALGHLKVFGVITTAGAPNWFTALHMGHAHKKAVLRGLKMLCAPQARHFWLCHYNMDLSSADSRRRFEAKIRRRLGQLQRMRW